MNGERYNTNQKAVIAILISDRRIKSNESYPDKEGNYM